MQRFGALSFLSAGAILSLASATTLAQNPSQPATPNSSRPIVVKSHTLDNSCPVGISAKRGWSGGAVAIDKNDPSAKANSGEPSQQLQILMRNLKAVGVTGARITAHGTAPGGRYVPARRTQTRSDHAGC